MHVLTHRRLAVALIIVAGAAAAALPLSPVSASSNKHHRHFGATMQIKPTCVSVSHKHRKLQITLRHGTRDVRYTFAVLPLFGNGKIIGPRMGRYRADRAGRILFRFPAPNHKRDAGRWQVTATRKLGYHRFRLAAIAHFHVKRGRCL